MPKYQKNKRRRRHSWFSFTTPDNIKMSSADKNSQQNTASTVKEKKSKSSFKVVKGKKQTNKIKRLVFAGILLTIIFVFVISLILLPTNLSDAVADATAGFSFKSEYPVKLNGSETYNSVLIGNHFYVVSDSDVSCYHKSGNLTFSDAHGFSYPVLCESEARCLVYEQNGNGIHVYNSKKKLMTINSKYAILSADISRNGYFAYASKAEKYTSMVTVCNDDGKNIFEWYCPEETINNVAVAPNGKSIAITTIFVANGKFNSKLYVLNFKSAEPVFTKEYSGEFIYGINSVNKKNFVIIGEKFCDIISWKKNEITTFNTEYSIDDVVATKSHIVIASSRENNDGNTSFEIYNNSRKKISSYVFSGPVDDFSVSGKKVYVLSRNNINMISADGVVKKKANCGFGVVKVLANSGMSSFAVSHNDVAKIKLKSE